MTMISYVGPDLPHDLLTATGSISGPVAWDIDRPMPAAERWLESKFPFWACSILQDWADGALDHLDVLLFSRADDAAQRLYYYTCELRRQGQIKGPEPLIFDVATIGRASSLDRTTAAIRQLAGRLGVSVDMLETGICQTNLNRTPQGPQPGSMPCCLISGTPPPDGRLHAVIEATGWQPVGSTLADTWRHLGGLVEEKSDDPFVAVAHQLRTSSQSSRGFFNRVSALEADVKRNGASAVLLWFAEEDEARIWHLPAQRASLASAGIPALILTRRDWRANDGVAQDIGQFLGELGA